MSFASMFRAAVLPNISSARNFCATSRLDKVGFIGLGNMGAGMARNLRKRGEEVIVFDVNQSHAENFARTEKTEVAHSPGELVSKGAQTIVSMVPTCKEVEEIYCGKGAIFDTFAKHGGKGGKLLCLDSTTGNPLVCKQVEAKALAAGAVYMDAPVSGGVNGARDGTLTFMVGGDQQHFEEARKILLKMGKNALHAGDVGAGCAAKICNNMLLAIEMIGVSESLNLGLKLGLDPKKLTAIINVSSGQCWTSSNYNPAPGVNPDSPPSKGYAQGFNSLLMLKDLSLSQQVAMDVRQPTPLGSLAHTIYRVMTTNPNYASKDFGVVFDYLQQQAIGNDRSNK